MILLLDRISMCQMSAVGATAPATGGMLTAAVEAASSDGGSVSFGAAEGIALQMVTDEGWGADRFHGCLEPLWEKESNWNPYAENPSSGAYGAPQSLPGSKMATHGDDWRTDPATRIAWGIDYVKGRCGDPCGAWAHSQANNWY